jgi:hypothetical protein
LLSRRQHEDRSETQGFNLNFKHSPWRNDRKEFFPMGSLSDFRNMNMPGMTKEIREELVAAFDAMSHWRDEIESVNERCLAKVLVQTSAVARSMGWPDQTIRATQEYLENGSKMQTKMIDQIMDGWKQQLKSPTAPMAIPRSFADQTPQPSGPSFAKAMSPWTFWLQAAEMWQRTWMPEVPPRKDRTH